MLSSKAFYMFSLMLPFLVISFPIILMTHYFYYFYIFRGKNAEIINVSLEMPFPDKISSFSRKGRNDLHHLCDTNPGCFHAAARRASPYMNELT